MTYLHLLNRQPESSRRKRNKKIQQVDFLHSPVAFGLRSGPKVASFLCNLQSTLQILIKQLTPLQQSQQLHETPEY